MSTRTRFENEATVVRKFSLTSRPIKCETTTDLNLIIRVFPRFKQVACFTLSPH